MIGRESPVNTKTDQGFRGRFLDLLKPEQRQNKTLHMGIPSFARRKASYYEKKNGSADKYLCMYAYGSQTLHSGGTESLYLAVNEAILRELSERSGEYTVLDLGCGVGRTLYDCAPLYPNALFVGMDLSWRMLQYGLKMLKGRKAFVHDVTFTGFGKVALKPKNLNNVILAHGSALALPFQSGVFDIVINTYLIDRIPEPSLAMKEMARVLKRGGLIVLADPLNWENPALWKQNSNQIKFMQEFDRNKLFVESWFDGMIYREVRDARGNYSDWNTLVIRARKQALNLHLTKGKK